MVERCWNAEVTGSIPVLFLFYSRLADANFSYSIMEGCLLKIERRIYYEQTSKDYLRSGICERYGQDPRIHREQLESHVH